MSGKHRTGPASTPDSTIRDVAKLAGVSVATVSRHVNGSGLVSPETAAKVESAMSQLQFTPSTSARNLATHKTSTIGLLMDHIAGDFFTPLLSGVEAEAAAAGYGIFTASTRGEGGQQAPRLPLGPHNVDAVIILPDSVSVDTMRRWDAMGFPMVIVYDSAPEGLAIPSVRIENTEAVTAAVLHLIRRHGRRRIAFLRGERGNEDAAEREGGYRAALALAGIPFDEALMLEGDYDTETARASVEAMMASGLRPGDGFDAVFAADDDSAWGAMLALRRRGVAVPDLVSVMGFDDQRYAEMMDPPLSTVRAPTELVGRLAARSLLARLKGDLSGKDVVLPTEAIFRRSCGCPASTYH